jgi:hypothetical protein
MGQESFLSLFPLTPERLDLLEQCLEVRRLALREIHLLGGLMECPFLNSVEKMGCFLRLPFELVEHMRHSWYLVLLEGAGQLDDEVAGPGALLIIQGVLWVD